MSRTEKPLRRKHRKQRKIRRQTWSNRSISDLDRDVAPPLLDLEYEITDEPIELPAEREPELHAAITDRRQKLFDRLHNDPASVIPDLESLLLQFPNSRILMNWLASAYQKSGNPENPMSSSSGATMPIPIISSPVQTWPQFTSKKAKSHRPRQSCTTPGT